MTSEELLLQLRDIQPPPEPAWWLIAPGYFVITAFLIGLFIIAWLLRRRQRNDRLAKLASLELQSIRAEYRQNHDVNLLAIKVSQWLKQVAMLAFPGSQLQSVSGEPWLKFLDQSLGHGPGDSLGDSLGHNMSQNMNRDQGDGHFSRGCGRIFGAGVYQSSVDLDADRIFALCERWLNAIKPQLQQRSRLQ
jgi:hypothetical protein